MSILNKLFPKKENLDNESQYTEYNEYADDFETPEDTGTLVDNKYSFDDIKFGKISIEIIENADEFSGCVIELSWSDNTFRPWAKIVFDKEITAKEILDDKEEIIILISQNKQYDQKDVIINNLKLMVEQNYTKLTLLFNGLSKEEIIEKTMNDFYYEIFDSTEYTSNYKFDITKCSYYLIYNRKNAEIYWQYDFETKLISDFNIDNFD